MVIHPSTSRSAANLYNRAMRFTKVEALGNDFLAIDGLAETTLAHLPQRPDFPELVRALCDRSCGVGADGALVLGPPDDPDAVDFRMRIFNADGAEAEMSGNGLRCAAMLAHARLGLLSQRVQTGAGVRAVEVRTDERGQFTGAIVDMGEPVFDLEKIGVIQDRLAAAVEGAIVPPTAVRGGRCGESSIDTGKHRPPGTAVGGTVEHTVSGVRGILVSMGNPHFVTFLDEPPKSQSAELAHLGAAIERHPAFPNRINIEFVHAPLRDRAFVLPWERGVGFTLASGTGACAALVAGVLAGRLDREAEIGSPGGALRVRWDEASGRVFLDGPATIVSEGDWPL
ncbi:MAG: diaminopimelate epimerase [Phycisphaeraceae bacterium]|nr:MAG: diaminopimelate epimerase [Phycisphaeraceae bacterium]